MKKLLLLSAFVMAGLISAKNLDLKDSKNVEKEEVKSEKQYLMTIKTVCGTLYQTVFDTDFDSYECLYNEWEIYNNQDCGHSSFENPMT